MKCENCKYHSTCCENGTVVGYVCLHPDETKKPGLIYGRYFGLLITSPKNCPLYGEKGQK